MQAMNNLKKKNTLFLSSLIAVLLMPFFLLNLNYQSPAYQTLIDPEVLAAWGDVSPMSPFQQYWQRALFPLVTWLFMYSLLIWKAWSQKANNAPKPIHLKYEPILFRLSILTAAGLPIPFLFSWLFVKCEGYGCLGSGVLIGISFLVLTIGNILSVSLYEYFCFDWNKKQRRLFLIMWSAAGLLTIMAWVS